MENLVLLEIYGGSAGKARRIPMTNPNRVAQRATLAAWLIEAPDQTPLTSFFMLGIIHLRPGDGAPAAAIRVPGATHEMLLCALDPQPGPRVDDLETLRDLTPYNAQVQFAATDELAVHVGAQAVKAICDGYMWAEGPSESVSQRAWTEIIANTLRHHAEGRHHV
jgi:hypothetical protein